MSDSRFPLFSSNFTQKDPWLIRIRENAKQLLSVSRLAPTSANGAAFHLLSFEHTRREGSAQSASLLTHGFAVGALVLFALHSPLRPACPDCVQKPSGPITYTAPLNPFHPKPGTSGNESGSDNNPIPATRGLLPPHSSIALAPPRIPENSSVKAPVPQAILDREAPELTTPVNDIGLPWMAEKTDSGGPGPGKGIGNGPGRRVGDGPDGGQGVGTPGMGHDGIASEPTCSY